MNKKELTIYTHVGKLSIKENDIKESRLTGRIILIVDCNQGGVTNITEFQKSDS